MIDLDKIEYDVDYFMKIFPGVRCVKNEDVKTLINALRADQDDADRYRHIRDCDSSSCMNFINAKASGRSSDTLDCIVDEMIDIGDL